MNIEQIRNHARKGEVQDWEQKGCPLNIAVFLAMMTGASLLGFLGAHVVSSL